MDPKCQLIALILLNTRCYSSDLGLRYIGYIVNEFYEIVDDRMRLPTNEILVIGPFDQHKFISFGGAFRRIRFGGIHIIKKLLF